MIIKVHFRGFHRFKENVFVIDEMMGLISSSELSVGEWVLSGGCGEHDEQCYDHEDGRNSQWRRIVRTKHEKTGKSGNSRGSTHLVAGVDDTGSSSRLAGAALPGPHGGDWAKGCTLPKSSEDHAK